MTTKTDGHTAVSAGPGEEPKSAFGGSLRWAMAAVVLVVLGYLLATWLQGGGGKSSGTSAQSALRSSFEHYKAGRYDNAITAAKSALAADPTVAADAYNNIAVSYLGLRQYDKAIEAAREAIRLRPDYQLAKNNLAWIQREMAKSAGAPGPVGPQSAVAALIDQSMQHAQAERFEECITTATQAAKLDPTAAPAFNNIGFCAAKLKRWDEGMRNLLEAIRLAPDFQPARKNLAWVLQEKRKAGPSTAN